MPIYEYQCKDCQHQFEMIQKINDAPARQCPVCLHLSVEKLVSAAGFQLKGSGWYATDFKDKPKKDNAANSPSQTEAPASTPAANEKAKSDSKPSSSTKGSKD